MEGWKGNCYFKFCDMAGCFLLINNHKQWCTSVQDQTKCFSSGACSEVCVVLSLFRLPHSVSCCPGWKWCILVFLWVLSLLRDRGSVQWQSSWCSRHARIKWLWNINILYIFLFPFLSHKKRMELLRCITLEDKGR